ncbi:MAG TPA: hypothetical protein VIY52_31160, partial [Streptosporangiaceae bacterium]
MIINHTDCGMLRFTDSEMEERLRKETGRAPIAPARFYSFADAEANTKEQIQKARSHPWISPEVPVRGFVYDVHTGRLSEVFPDGETVVVVGVDGADDATADLAELPGLGLGQRVEDQAADLLDVAGRGLGHRR